MARLGQQDTQDYSPDYSYVDPYIKKRQQDLEGQFGNLQQARDLSSVSQEAAGQAGASTDTQPMVSKEFASGASRGMSGGLGSALMSGGLASGNPYAMAGGLGVMALEGDAQAKQKQQEAQIQEAQMRKQQQLNAINSLIAVSKGLTV